MRAACPVGALPDHGACIPIPLGEAIDDGPSLEVEQNEHHDRKGRLVRYEHIPRRPERPEDYHRYVLPIPIPKDQAFLGSGYDLDRPDSEQRRGFGLKAVGHGGVDLASPRGTPVHVVRLEHQQGDADVLFVGELFGTSVVTRHTVTESGAPHDYLIVHGHLERANANIHVGDALPVSPTRRRGAASALAARTRSQREDHRLRSEKSSRARRVTRYSTSLYPNP